MYFLVVLDENRVLRVNPLGYVRANKIIGYTGFVVLSSFFGRFLLFFYFLFYLFFIVIYKKIIASIHKYTVKANKYHQL